MNSIFWPRSMSENFLKSLHLIFLQIPDYIFFVFGNLPDSTRYFSFRHLLILLQKPVPATNRRVSVKLMHDEFVRRAWLFAALETQRLFSEDRSPGPIAKRPMHFSNQPISAYALYTHCMMCLSF